MPNFLPKHRAREYETVFIVHPETPSDGVDQISTRLTDVIARLNGRLLRAENWGRRRLSYAVRKNTKGIYLYLKYLGYSDMVAELERNMRMLEPVIKFITVRLEEDVNPETRVVREGDISFVSQYEEEPEREPMDAGRSFDDSDDYRGRDSDRGRRGDRDMPPAEEAAAVSDSDDTEEDEE